MNYEIEGFSMVETRKIEIQTKKHLDIIDITDKISDELSKSNIKNGIVNIFIPGSTGAITTIEYEEGLKKDLEIFLEKLLPYHAHYFHHNTWGDDNGCGHLLSALLKTSLTVPFVNKKLILGTWQQIIFFEFDTRPRYREIILQIIGD